MPPPGYTEFSRTTSGGVIYENKDAPPAQRWLIEHTVYGDKYFADHDDILMWTVNQMEKHIKLLFKDV